MSQQHTLTALRALKLNGMADALDRQFSQPGSQDDPFEERLDRLVDAERLARENRRLARLLKQAQLKVQASAEDIDYRASRGLDKRQIHALLGCEWVLRQQNVILTGPTGVGKTWLACALAQQAARQGLSALYRRLPRFLEELELARETSELPKRRTQLAKIKLLVLDDWGVAPINARGRQDLLEVIDDRVGSGSLLITSQLPIAKWHAYLGNPTIADAILDRIVHSAHRIDLQGESMRKLRSRSNSTKA